MCLSKDAPVITGGLTANEQHTENELCSLNKVEVRTTNSSMSKTPKFPPLHSLKCLTAFEGAVKSSDGAVSIF